MRAAIDRVPPGDFEKRWGAPGIYNQAAFVYCRDSLSLRYLRRQKLAPPILELGFEGAFAADLRDEARAEAWLRRHGLERDRYVCVIPRLRFAPYYKVKNLPRSTADHEIDRLNARAADQDHAAIRDVMIRWVRETGHKVVACPEMTYHIETARVHLVEPLPEDVRRKVIWRDDYWRADEATSVFARAAAVIGADCHSPIIALANGTPSFYVRNPTDTVKGEMFRDIGVGDWLFEVGETSGQQLWERLRPIYEDLPKARTRVRQIMEKLWARQQTMVESIGRAIARSSHRR